MYKVSEHVVYGAGKVCEVEQIAELKLTGTAKQYYVLHPLNKKDERIYVPVQNEAKSIHKVISKEQALTIIDTIPSVEPLEITSERAREQEYKELMYKKDYVSLIKLIKSIHIRNEKRLARGKKATATDVFYLQTAKEALESELADALNLEIDQVPGFIDARLNHEE